MLTPKRRTSRALNGREFQMHKPRWESAPGAENSSICLPLTCSTHNDQYACLSCTIYTYIIYNHISHKSLQNLSSMIHLILLSCSNLPVKLENCVPDPTPTPGHPAEVRKLPTAWPVLIVSGLWPPPSNVRVWVLQELQVNVTSAAMRHHRYVFEAPWTSGDMGLRRHWLTSRKGTCNISQQTGS